MYDYYYIGLFERQCSNSP